MKKELESLEEENKRLMELLIKHSKGEKLNLSGINPSLFIIYYL